MNDQNLTPWTKGKSGNPAGRKKGSRNRASIIRDFMEQVESDPTAGGKFNLFKNGRIKGLRKALKNTRLQ